MPVETPAEFWREKRRILAENERRKREGEVRWIEDFPFEVIEEITRHLEPKDVPKLMMVNKRLYSGYAWNESIVFGDHVDEIQLGKDWCLIRKHPDSQEVKLGFDRHLHLIKRVTSCDKLWVGTESIDEAHQTILKQLMSVNCLWTHFFMKSVAELTKFITHLHASVKEYADLDFELDSFEEDQSVSELLGDFFEKQLADCEEIQLRCRFEELFHVCSQALKKTRVKMIEMKLDNSFWAVQWIVKHGIPSKKPEAGFYTPIRDSLEKRNEIISFLTKYPGMKQMMGENRVSLLQEAKSVWKHEPFDKEIFCFRQEIDLEKDCIYVIESGAGNFDACYFAGFYASYSLSTPTSIK